MARRVFTTDESARIKAQSLRGRMREKPALWAMASSRFEFRSLNDADAQVQVVEQMLSAAAAATAPSLVLPVLVNAIGQSYYPTSAGDPPSADDPSILGPALKIALAASWRCLWKTGQHASHSSSDLDWLVGVAQILEQLQVVRSLFSAAQSGSATMDADGVQATGEMDALAQALASAFAPRGQVQRLAATTATTILRRATHIAIGIERVLHGDPPARVPELQGCWLSRFPNGEPPAFWEGLQARLMLFAVVVQHVDSGVTSTDAVQFSDLVLAVGQGVGGDARQTIAQDLFWRRDWVDRQPTRAYRDLIVDRPVLRVASNPARYCTSIALLGDAVNRFVETSVIRHPGSSGVPLSSSSFRTLLSEPFERQVQSELRGLSFRAAQVTKSGTWLTDQHVELAAVIGPPPGEIDVLAVHSSGILLVVECKVLAAPDTDERMRNFLGKIGDQDSESILKKVAAKLDWARRASRLLIGRPCHEIAVVVLDRPWPGMRFGEEVSVVDLPLLRDALSITLSAR